MKEMSNEEILNLGNVKIDQLGFVFKDIEKKAKIMEELYGMPKFAILPPRDITGEYRGKESNYRMKVAVSTCFGVQMELIQWIEGNTIHKEFIDSGREGLHHISIYVDDLAAFIKRMEEKGINKSQEGYVGKKIHYAYFDTEETLGFILEVQEVVKRQRKK